MGVSALGLGDTVGHAPRHLPARRRGSRDGRRQPPPGGLRPPPAGRDRRRAGPRPRRRAAAWPSASPGSSGGGRCPSRSAAGCGLWLGTAWLLGARGWYVSPLFPTLALVGALGIAATAPARRRARASRPERAPAPHGARDDPARPRRRSPRRATSRRARTSSGRAATRAPSARRWRPSRGPELPHAGTIDLIARLAAIHDIGKVGVATGRSGSPGPSPTDEREEMSRHPIYGRDVIGADRGVGRGAGRFPSEAGERSSTRTTSGGTARDTRRACGERRSSSPAGWFALVDVYDVLRKRARFKGALPARRGRPGHRGGAGGPLRPDVVDAFLGIEAERRRIAIDSPTTSTGIRRTRAAASTRSGRAATMTAVTAAGADPAPRPDRLFTYGTLMTASRGDRSSARRSSRGKGGSAAPSTTSASTPAWSSTTAAGWRASYCASPTWRRGCRSWTARSGAIPRTRRGPLRAAHGAGTGRGWRRAGGLGVRVQRAIRARGRPGAPGRVRRLARSPDERAWNPYRAESGGSSMTMATASEIIKNDQSHVIHPLHHSSEAAGARLRDRGGTRRGHQGHPRQRVHRRPRRPLEREHQRRRWRARPSSR